MSSARLARSLLAALLVIGGVLGLSAGASAQDRGTAVVVELDAAIDPASADFLSGALDDAESDGAALVIVRLDTPGGLLDSTRQMTDAITESPLPVVVYVAPDGARAASAGLFVTQAADVAAMAPQTNIGAATPINADGSDIDSDLGQKITNDAAAYVSALAKSHDRNGDLAASMVTDAVSVDSEEALDEDLIDFVEPDTESLLGALDGFELAGPKGGTLDTAGLELEEVTPSFTDDLAAILLNPTVSFLLLTVGLIGLAIELFAPGTIVPGAIGALSLFGGLFGALQLPITILGVALLLLGIGLIIAEAYVVSGVLGIAGIISIALGGLFLFDTQSDVVAVSVPAVIVLAVVLGGFAVFAGRKAMQARHEPVRTGEEEMVGMIGRVREPLDPAGLVFVAGALWKARGAAGLSGDELEELRRRESRVTVVAVDGLTLAVVPGERELTGGGAPTSPTGRSLGAGSHSTHS
ncbi:nodulation protein NfeD [Thermoleophilia bacterium SCSIO 60948]|nr:nodulation protein NfeD [Thermoleophilia bacterium SCSIO 60948]